MKNLKLIFVVCLMLLNACFFRLANAGNSCTVDSAAATAFKTCAVDPYWIKATLVQLHFCETFPNWESNFDNCTSAGIEPSVLSLSVGDSATLSSTTKPEPGTYKYLVEVYLPEVGIQADMQWDTDVWMRSDDPTDQSKGGKFCWTLAGRDQCGPAMGVAEKQIYNRTGYSENDHCPVLQYQSNPGNGRFLCARGTGTANYGTVAIDAPINENEYVAGTYNGFQLTSIAAQGSLTSLSRSLSAGNETYDLNINFLSTPIVISETTSVINYDVKLTGSVGSSYTAQNMYNASDPNVSAWLYDNPNNEYVLNNITSLGLTITVTAN